MSIPWILIVVVVAALAFLLMRGGGVPDEVVKSLLQRGAVVIDVRSPGEFASGAVAGAKNLPLGDVEKGIEKLVPDKSQPVLMHCLSGGRSAMAVSKLKALGYQEVHNLGSYSRAKSLAEVNDEK
jgi:rhodanese-related sulfurtransferase